MSDRLVPTVVVLTILVVALLGMWIAWRARSRRDAGVAGSPLPAEGIHPTLTTGVLYVATTRAGQPLERLAIRGLGFRANADLTVAEEGVVLAIPAQDPVFLPAASLRSASTATWTIDRVVESDGLIALQWRWGDIDVDSYFRVIDPTRNRSVLSALTSLTAPAPAGHSDSTTESEK
ncbi:hypothetical protein D9V29_05150 [Mycetocola manganoxydans]|uniref:PH domain-containing protein n=1 Tax=Mycetocola manganoxydans TaxID=699879 RepID=A0A3L6ZX89_9MICO|nr:hypothetical protein [Mycetocola manganoxydans]RLP72527.1 hypothetical protein D9V29_05150 [Mycetocola manganoxydans]GHD39862.1 hypothetical protein GCM10008097_03280 [Mycetocola manganoxydans]